MSEAVRQTAAPILEIENLSISFFTRAGEIPAVMDFSCTVMPGEAMGIVGESGCGKSTVALGIMRDLSSIGKIVGGRIKFQGRDMGDLSDAELRALRGSKIAMIYQEPMASLNPAMKVGKQLMEVPLIHEKVSKTEAYQRSLDYAEGRAPAGPGTDDALLSSSALRRPAAAHRHRHGAAVEPGAAPARRAHDRARRDGRGRHRRPREGSRQAPGHVDDLRVAQSGPDPGDLRPHNGHVFRRGRRNRLGQGCLRPHAPPLHAGPVPLDPAARRRQERKAVDRHPRPAAAAARAPEGLQFRPALPSFREGSVRRRRDTDDRGRGARQSLQSLRPLQRDRLVGDARGSQEAERTRQAGRDRAPDRRSPEVLPGRGERGLRRRRRPRGEGQRDDQLRSARVGDGGDRRRIRLRQVDPGQGAPRPGDGKLRQYHAGEQGDPIDRRRVAGRADGRVDPDGVPEPVRHAEPQPHGGLPDHSHAGEIQDRRRPGRAAPEDAGTPRPR